MAPPTSLVPQNKLALDYFIQTPVTTQMVAYLARKAASVIRCDQAASASELPTPPTTPPAHETCVPCEPGLPSLEEYITSIVQQSHVQVPTLMPALVYLDRLRAKLPQVAQGIPSTVHRIFLAALILSAKNLNDSSPKNKHWARYTSVPGYPEFGFTNSEVNLMEKQLLYLLDWDLNITNDDLYYHLEPFLAPIRIKQQQQAERKMQAMLRERERTAQLQQAQMQFEIRQQQRKQQQALSLHAASQPQHHLPRSMSHARFVRSNSSSRDLYAYSPKNMAYSATPEAYSRSSSVRPPTQGSARTPMRTPSLSPPSRCKSSGSYSSSASASPASFMAHAPTRELYTPTHHSAYPTKPQEAKIQLDTFYEQDEQYAYQYGYEVPQVVHLRPLHAAAHAVKIVTDKSLPPRPREDLVDAKPAKKLKTSAGNLLSRLLNAGNIGSINHAAPLNPQLPVAVTC